MESETTFLDKIRILDQTTLKLIAIVSMAIDHCGAVFFPQAIWMRLVGRIAMPIFCFFVAEGYRLSSDRPRYLLRMGIFALISEIPFDMALFEGRIGFEYQNVMWTFFFAILALMAYNKIKELVKGLPGRLLGALASIAIAFFAVLLSTDYSAYGVGLVLIFYVMYEKGLLAQNAVAALYQIATSGQSPQSYAVISAVPLMMYSGKKGKGFKWFFYSFYPLHLTIIWILRDYVLG